MKALQFHASGDLRVDDLEEPACGKGEVKVSPVGEQHERDITMAPDANGILWNLWHRYVYLSSAYKPYQT